VRRRHGAWGVLLLAVLLAGAAPALAAGARGEAVVVVPVENMYSGPDATKDVVSQALLGQVVGVLEAKDGFVQIETPDGYPGWIPQAAVFVYPDEKAPRYAAQGPVAEVVALMANLYRDPSVTSARPKAQAPLATRLEVIEGPQPPENRWLRVRLPDGETAHVQAGDVRLADAAAAAPRGTPDDLVATARRFTGVPYLWGGMSAHGVDCSGFVGQVYRANGVVLPRDADLQFDDPKARPVEKADLAPGDLVFFGEKKITHVGMYVGGGRFINATTYQTPVVREDVLDDPHWTALYRGARRPR
jgi:gamma-D-glutamyl-L-lysine dipeptidyl-peptidase